MRNNIIESIILQNQHVSSSKLKHIKRRKSETGKELTVILYLPPSLISSLPLYQRTDGYGLPEMMASAWMFCPLRRERILKFLIFVDQMHNHTMKQPLTDICVLKIPDMWVVFDQGFWTADRKWNIWSEESENKILPAWLHNFF